MDEGILFRINRSIQAEVSFGNLKQDMRFRRYVSRGTSNVLVESTLLAMVGNINKLHNKIIWSFFLKSYIKTAKMKLSLHDFSIVSATAPFESLIAFSFKSTDL